MCLFKKRGQEEKEPEEKRVSPSAGSVFLTAMKDSPSNTQQEEIEAYWIYGNPGVWHCSLWSLVANRYQFGAAICNGKMRCTLENHGYGWETVHQEPVGECNIVSEETVFETVQDIYCWIDTQEEWKSIRDDRYYYEVFVPKKVVALLSGKYSESFSMLLASKSLKSRDLIQRAITLYEEGLSPDMRAYLLLVDNENKRTG